MVTSLVFCGSEEVLVSLYDFIIWYIIRWKLHGKHKECKYHMYCTEYGTWTMYREQWLCLDPWARVSFSIQT
jgi:hypothetical protein